MFTDVQIVNLGLSKLGSARIARIDPPRTSLESFVSAGYVHWKRSEMAKRRWCFALEVDAALAKVAEVEGSERPYKYELPTDCLRPIRRSGTEWVQTGRFLRSAIDSLKVDYVRNVDEADFDPLFVEVLACRIAVESVEYVTQSNTKKADAKALYDEAVADASKNNAFVIGPESNGADDSAFPLLTARY